MRETAGSAAAPAARRKNFRRGSFIGSSSLIALSHARTWARARPAFAEPTLERAVGWRRTLATLELAHPRPEGCDHCQPAGEHAPCCEQAPPPIGGYVAGRLLARRFLGTTVQRDWHRADAEPRLGPCLNRGDGGAIALTLLAAALRSDLTRAAGDSAALGRR